MAKIPSRPYLLRALYDWILDNGWSPYIMVNAELSGVLIPKDLVSDKKIVFDISLDAAHDMKMDNNALEFDARFGSDVRHVYLPIMSIVAIYAKENSDGMIFPEEMGQENLSHQTESKSDNKKKKSSLTIIK